MNANVQLKQRNALVPLVLGFALTLFLCSAVSAQTQIGPNPNPDGNTITIGLDMMNDENFVNNGTIETLEGTRWEFINNSGAVIDNAGTINIHPPAVFETAWFINYGIINNLADGIVNSDYSFSSAGSGIMNNYGTINGSVQVYDNSVLNNYNEINNSYSLSAINESTINNYGVINDPDLFYAVGESTINNYGVINNPEMTFLEDYGTFNNHGVINDITLFYSYDSSIVNNYGTFNNTGLFLNYSDGYVISGEFLYGFENHETTVNDGTFENRGGVENTGTFENNGIINNRDYGIVNKDNGIFVNNGSFLNYSLGNYISGEYLYGFENRETTVNNGTFENWGNINNTGTFENNGIINNRDYGIDNSDSGIFVNNGTFYDLGGLFNNLGTYQGTGTYIGTLNTGTGTVAPGNSTGTMYVDGDYVLDIISIWTGAEWLDFPGTLQIEIGGFDPGEYDFLDITGTAFLPGGTIDLMFLEGYDISMDIGYGESLSLMFLKADLGIDSFLSTVTYDFLGTPSGFLYDVFQQDNGLWFSATNTNTEPGPGPGPDPDVIPAPGALLLSGIGVGFVSWLRRRRTL